MRNMMPTNNEHFVQGDDVQNRPLDLATLSRQWSGNLPCQLAEKEHRKQMDLGIHTHLQIEARSNFDWVHTGVSDSLSPHVPALEIKRLDVDAMVTAAVRLSAPKAISKQPQKPRDNCPPLFCQPPSHKVPAPCLVQMWSCRLRVTGQLSIANRMSRADFMLRSTGQWGKGHERDEKNMRL